MNFHVFRLGAVGLRMLLSRHLSAVSLGGLRRLSTVRCAGPAATPGPLVAAGPDMVSSVVSSVASVNPRLAALALTAWHLAGAPLLRLPTAIGPSAVKCPTMETFAVKRFIVEDTRKVVSEPEKPTARVEEPRRPEQVRKHAIRMLVLRRKKMKKHQLKKLWQRMGGRFRTDKVAREKKKELLFRAQLAAKVIIQICSSIFQFLPPGGVGPKVFCRAVRDGLSGRFPRGAGA
jgi:hypothetical protein